VQVPDPKPAAAVTGWTLDPEEARSFIVQQPDPRFEARARQLRGPWYALRIIDRNTGKPIPRVGAIVPLTGRNSVNRAVKYAILRFDARRSV
jgi:hypothetical protein